MAGGYKQFGPTYKSTDYLRLGYEGLLNGVHDFDPDVVANKDEELLFNSSSLLQPFELPIVTL